MTMKNYGMMDSIWGLVLGSGLQVFNVILAVNFFKNLPVELEEACFVDGGGPWRNLITVYGTVPPLNSIQNTKIHMNTSRLGNCFFVLDSGYAAMRIHTILTTVPNTTRLMDTRKDPKKSLSPMIF